MGVAGQGHVAEAVTGAVLAWTAALGWCARRAVSLPCPAVVPAGAVAGVAPGSLGIWLGESPG